LTTILTPTGVQGLSQPSRAIQVVAGLAFSCALLSDGTAQCWGSDANGQLANGVGVTPTTAASSAFGSGYTSLSAGSSHACARQSSGQAVCWGLNSSDQLSSPAPANTTEHSPRLVTSDGASAVGGIKLIQAGGSTTCLVSSSDDVFCWGNDTFEQRGDGAGTNPSPYPVSLSVTGPARLFHHIDVGATHACATSREGAVACWGDNSYGQIGTAIGNSRVDATWVHGI
jgi:alpha-tubulin suppressor-like RCC1 family protein